MRPFALLILAALLLIVSPAPAAGPRAQTRGEVIVSMAELREGHHLDLDEASSPTARDGAALDAQLRAMAQSCVARWPRRGPITRAHYAALELGQRLDEMACWLGGHGAEIGRQAVGRNTYWTFEWGNPDGSRLVARVESGLGGGRLVALTQDRLPAVPTDPAEQAQIASLAPDWSVALTERFARARAARMTTRLKAQQQALVRADPCQVGEIKLDRETGLSYQPTDAPYAVLHDRARIACTQTERGARTYGYMPYETPR